MPDSISDPLSCISLSLPPLLAPLPSPPSSPSQVGGQLDLHGMPGSASTPSWTRIGMTAYAGASSLLVVDDVSAWPVGGTVAIASTDIDLNQAETAVITKG